MGWEFIDDIVWEKPEYSVKNRIGGFQQHRKPLAYKPNSVTEYLMVYRKQTDKLIDWNIHQWNPESVDAIIARGSDVFVADTLSQQNKNQCDQLGVSWVAWRDNEGYKRFEKVLQRFDIPYTPYKGNLDEDLKIILEELWLRDSISYL